MPDNINSYKKNNFAGRVVSGKGVTPQRDNAPTITNNKKPERYYTQSQVQLSQGRSQNTGPSVRGCYDMQSTQRESCNPTTGIAGPGQNADGTYVPVNTTRMYDSSLDSCNTCDTNKIGAPHMAGYGTGAYGTSSYLIADSQREQCLPGNTNVHSQAGGQGVYYNDGANATQREMQNMYIGNAAGDVASYQSHGYTSGITQREEQSTTYMGMPRANGNSVGTNGYSVNLTQRENVNTTYGGPAGSSHKAGSTYDTARNACSYYQREEMSKEHTPNAGNMNLRADPNNVLPHMIVKDDCSLNNNVGAINGPRAIPGTNIKGQVEYVPKMPVQNNRLDLNIAEQQLSSNDVSHNINYKQTNK